TVTEIANLAVECAGLRPSEVEFEYTGGNRGWKGDIPIVRLNTNRIRSLGWVCSSNSREALRDSMMAMLADFKAARLLQGRSMSARKEEKFGVRRLRHL